MGRDAFTTTFRRLKGILRSSTDREFERAVLPWVRVLWLDTIPAPALGSYDKIGVDLIAWKTDKHAKLVVQCKGFKANEQEMGGDQIRQCLDSIEKFAASGQHTDTYLLIYNRYGKHDEFRDRIGGALARLTASGQARHAELWPCDKLLRESTKVMRRRFLRIMRDRSAAVRPSGDVARAELHEVPLRHAQLVIDRYQMKEASSAIEVVTDPAKTIIALGVGRDARLVLLGEAGFGKTTAAIRATRTSRVAMFFVRASTLIEGVNKHALLSHFQFFDELLEGLPSEDQAVVFPLAKIVIDGLFTTPGTPAVLVIDGLDESVAVARRGGLQWLFNSFLRYEVPIVLTARTEFWRARQADFATSFGMRAPTKGPMQRDARVQVLELKPWDNEQILALSNEYMAGLSGALQQRNVLAFIQLVREGGYESTYGDIPRRPLFLKLILETVADSGIHRVSRSQLFDEWARHKIRRDYAEPLLNQGAGRVAITGSGEPVESTIAIAFAAMRRAARLMCQIRDRSIDMFPTCRIRDVLSGERLLSAVVDPLGLFLNSLLVPTDNLGLEGAVRFGHGIYQEYFLARYIADNSAEFEDVVLPSAVQDWLDDFRGGDLTGS